MDHKIDQATEPRRKRRLPLANTSVRTRSVVLATGLLVIGITPFAAARTGDNLREGVRNGTTVRETEIISNVPSTTALTGGYSTRQSNLSASGGGAIYGCRSGAGGSAAKPRPQNPCLRANNLSRGYAFEFQSTQGAIGGLISVAGGGDSTKPFTTNATGVATGLNADRVDGQDAADLIKAATTASVAASQALQPLAQVAADGTAGASRGTNGTNPITRTGTGVYTVAFSGDLSKCSTQATITGGDFGEITVTPAVANGNTTVTVRTANSAGVAADRPFHLVANC